MKLRGIPITPWAEGERDLISYWQTIRRRGLHEWLRQGNADLYVNKSYGAWKGGGIASSVYGALHCRIRSMDHPSSEVERARGEEKEGVVPSVGKTIQKRAQTAMLCFGLTNIIVTRAQEIWTWLDLRGDVIVEGEARHLGKTMSQARQNLEGARSR